MAATERIPLLVTPTQKALLIKKHDGEALERFLNGHQNER